MHEIQRKILSLVQLDEMHGLSYRQLAERTGCEYPAQARHHLIQLVKRGYLVKEADGKLVTSKSRLSPGRNVVFSLPILGEADCGEATRVASDEIRGYLTVSPGALTARLGSRGEFFALKACGNSMDRCQIHGKTIENGDYIVVEKCNAAEIKDGDRVVSIFNGLANVKKFHRDNANRRIVLLSESYHSYPPIIIANDDLQYYQPVGKVIDVIKSVDHLM